LIVAVKSAHDEHLVIKCSTWPLLTAIIIIWLVKRQYVLKKRLQWCWLSFLTVWYTTWSM